MIICSSDQCCLFIPRKFCRLPGFSYWTLLLTNLLKYAIFFVKIQSNYCRSYNSHADLGMQGSDLCCSNAVPGGAGL